MRFCYEYRNSSNERCKGVVSASSKDAAYRKLKDVGIRPSRVYLAPGLFNKFLSIGFRGFFILVLLVALALLGSFVYFDEGAPAAPDRDSPIVNVFESTTRRQVIGDAVMIEKETRTGWASVFPEEGERFLASFAIPGVEAGVRNTSEEALVAALDRTVAPTEDDSIEVRQIKSIVEGMKNEMRAFLRAGGSAKEYGIRLVQRQEQEIAIYNRAANELSVMENSGVSSDDYMELWERRNNDLHRMGIRQVPLSRAMLNNR